MEKRFKRSDLLDLFLSFESSNVGDVQLWFPGTIRSVFKFMLTKVENFTLCLSLTSTFAFPEIRTHRQTRSTHTGEGTQNFLLHREEFAYSYITNTYYDSLLPNSRMGRKVETGVSLNEQSMSGRKQPEILLSWVPITYFTHVIFSSKPSMNKLFFTPQRMSLDQHPTKYQAW